MRCSSDTTGWLGSAEARYESVRDVVGMLMVAGVGEFAVLRKMMVGGNSRLISAIITHRNEGLIELARYPCHVGIVDPNSLANWAHP